MWASLKGLSRSWMQVPLLKEYPRSADKNSDAAKNPMFDGHSIDLVGYHEGSEFPGGGYFIFRNSFGRRFGHGGTASSPSNTSATTQTMPS